MKKYSFILMLGDEGALLLPPANLKDARPLLAQDHTEESAAPLISLLKRAPHNAIHILADFRTQHLKLDSLPSLSYFDRKNLLKRRIEKAFPQSSLRGALHAPNNQVLMFSLEETDTLNLWRERLSKLLNPFNGTSLLPLELTGFLETLLPETKSAWRLLLIWHKTGGYRQIVTYKNKVVFTRLTQSLPPITSLDFACNTLAVDVQATRRYLGRLGLARKEILPLAAILPFSLKSTFQRIPLESTKALVFTPQEAAFHLNLKADIKTDEESGDLISLLWATKSFRWQSVLMSYQEKRNWYARMIKRGGMAFAIFVLTSSFLCLTMAGVSLIHAYNELNLLSKEVAMLNEEFTSLQKSFAPATQPLGRLREAVEKKRFFTENMETPKDLAPSISKILKGIARLKSLSWKKDEIILDILLLPQKDTLGNDIIIKIFDNLKHTMEEELQGYNISISHYPFPNLPQETLTNKETRLPELVAQFILRKEAL